MAAHEWSCLSGRSVEGFLDPARQFWRDLTYKKRDGADILPAGPGGSTLIKILENEYGGTSISP